jgi:hypothetical protein
VPRHGSVTVGDVTAVDPGFDNWLHLHRQEKNCNND